MKTLSNHEISDKSDLLQEKNSLLVNNSNVIETTKKPIDLDQVCTKFNEKVKAYDKALKVIIFLFFFIIGTVIFTKLLIRALDIESSTNDHVMLDYKENLNKQAPFDAPYVEKE